MSDLKSLEETPQIAQISATWDVACGEMLKLYLLVLPRSSGDAAFVGLGLQYLAHGFVSIPLNFQRKGESILFPLRKEGDRRMKVEQHGPTSNLS